MANVAIFRVFSFKVKDACSQWAAVCSSNCSQECYFMVGSSASVYYVHIWLRQSKTQNNAKALLNQKNYILRAKRITDVEIDGIIENIRLKIGDDSEDHTNGAMATRWIQMLYSTRRETKKVKILALVKQRITNTQVLKESSTQVGTS